MAELAVMAATGLGASAGTAATIGTIASVGLTAASAFGSIQSGKQQAAVLNIQARQADLNARSERLRGRQQAIAIQDQLSRDLASQNAIFATRGVLQGEGTAEAARTASETAATRDIDTARFNAEISALNSEQRAANARSDASAAKKAGVFDALTTVGGYKSVSVPGVENFGRIKTGRVPLPGRKPSLLG